jgi:hypothetical protein
MFFKSIKLRSWRKLHNDELHSLYSSPNLFRVVKSRRMRWAGHVARMGRGEVFTGFWFGGPKGRDHWEDLSVGGRIILRWTLREIGINGANSIQLAQSTVRWRVFVNTVMNLWVP